VSAGLAFFIVATPVGWLGLVIGGLAIAGADAVAAVSMVSAMKNNSGGVYDAIMKWLGL